ncbi:MAG TPA: YlbE-like family protein [Bacilli bacterium]|jgi:hypothetical protein|nr:MAG: hypothetical protein BWX94_00100 [Tenericutes bacterium ADurb.Bin140]HOE77286.1 YlbE-like family protein [Bacilli bacterium]HON64710.1 YlbE-like family protein [Bacilli bacterium]HOR95479.1 YlbE-like family protein [Bacilli bacterium]HPD11774.1 YlbE-like family protein [Bacilli bacterium]
MDESILKKIYANELYLRYLRYNPKWYLILNENPGAYKEFERTVKIATKQTASDKIENFRKQLEFINGVIRYLNS